RRRPSGRSRRRCCLATAARLAVGAITKVGHEQPEHNKPGLGMLGGPIAPLTIPLGAAGGAALLSGGTEAAQIGLERAMGWPAAEPGTFGQRVGNAAIRGGTFEAAPIFARRLPSLLR